jgi:NAD(P)-dependent dehydrogenase (short-subunit alcohol dehydrogenase family)
VTRPAPPRAVVTGGSRGIGAAIVDRLAADGFDVVALDIVLGEGVIASDVSDPTSVAAAAAAIGPVDVLVNNAAIWRFAPLEDVSLEDFDQVLAVNVRGPFLCSQAFGRGMLQRRRGSIVNIVSIAASLANPAVGAYSASKAALLALTRQTAVEWGPRGVRCNAVGPGLIPTTGAQVYDDPDVRARRGHAVPLQRLGEAREVAEVVAFMASDRASYVNGQVVYVDGGFSHTLMTTLPRPSSIAGAQLATTSEENG